MDIEVLPITIFDHAPVALKWDIGHRLYVKYEAPLVLGEEKNSHVCKSVCTDYKLC